VYIFLEASKNGGTPKPWEPIQKWFDLFCEGTPPFLGRIGLVEAGACFWGCMAILATTKTFSSSSHVIAKRRMIRRAFKMYLLGNPHMYGF